MRDRRPSRLDEAIGLMSAFAERTGLTSDEPQRRYLWTDAFAVCNFLELARRTGESRYADLAHRLIDGVHHTLGCHRPDDPRTGWLSGLPPAQGEAHPTRGGLRIGKSLPERRIGEPFDEQLEWDRDGQYFHYLTKWVHALDQASRATSDPRYALWARELAKVASDAFTYRPAGGRSPRMAWKMSVDLSRALVPSMGQHDPLDGLITCMQLEATGSAPSRETGGVGLREEVKTFAAMVDANSWTTTDPLGLGGLLADACRVAQLTGRHELAREALLRALLAAAIPGLMHYADAGVLRRPASTRLGFRELGLAIGLHGLDLMKEVGTAAGGSSREIHALLEALAPYRSVAVAIESFWLDPENRRARSWSEHRDINEVMLATCLVPEGFLRLSTARGEPREA